MSRLLNLLICVGFAVRSLLPVGFMLATTPDHVGVLQIVICTGHGLQSVVLDERGVPQKSKSSAGDKTICPYAPVGAVSADNHNPQLLSQIVRYAAVTYAIAVDIFRATPRASARSARGPPSLV